MAEAEGFEPPMPFDMPVFKTDEPTPYSAPEARFRPFLESVSVHVSVVACGARCDEAILPQALESASGVGDTRPRGSSAPV